MKQLIKTSDFTKTKWLNHEKLSLDGYIAGSYDNEESCKVCKMNILKLASFYIKKSKFKKIFD